MHGDVMCVVEFGWLLLSITDSTALMLNMHSMKGWVSDFIATRHDTDTARGP